MTQASIPVWLDCDPGTDDAFAILLAVFHPLFKLVGISTVHGNAPLESTTHNALGLLQVLRVNNIPVYPGEAKPLVKDPFFGLYAHGKTGMGGADLPETTTLQPESDKSYIEAIRDAVLEHENEICIIATGTFTNMSKLFKKYPEIKLKVKYISIMGGSFGFGNVTPYAEFNCYVDPKAANDLFHDEVLQNKIIVNGLNITHTAVADQKIRSMLFDKPEKSFVRSLFESVLTFYFNRTYSEKHFAGPPLHDPLAVYTLLPVVFGPEEYVFKYSRRKISAIEGGVNDGETVFDDGSKFEDDVNDKSGCIIAKSCDIHMFYLYVAEALDNAEAHYNSSDPI